MRRWWWRKRKRRDRGVRGGYNGGLCGLEEKKAVMEREVEEEEVEEEEAHTIKSNYQLSFISVFCSRKWPTVSQGSS